MLIFSHRYPHVFRVIGVIALLSGGAPHVARALECPLPQPKTTPAAIKEPRKLIEDYSALLSAQGSKAVTKIISSVRARHPDASGAEITNFIVTIYCPVVQRNAALSETEKRERLKRISSKLLSKLAR